MYTKSREGFWLVVKQRQRWKEVHFSLQFQV